MKFKTILELPKEQLDELTSLFSVVPDRQLALKFNLDRNQVGRYRRNLGKPAYSHSTLHRKLDYEAIRKYVVKGISDPDIAILMNSSAATIRYIRTYELGMVKVVRPRLHATHIRNQKICNLHKEGKRRSEIAHEMNLSVRLVEAVLRRNKTKRQLIGHNLESISQEVRELLPFLDLPAKIHLLATSSRLRPKQIRQLLGISKSTLYRYLSSLGLVKKVKSDPKE